MTARKSFTVDAQWALQGKTLGRDGYRVLACSTGPLSMQHFTEAIGRFSMGTPVTLPQVTISYLTHGVTSHLALAVHQLASDAQPGDGALMARDDDGRPVVATSYYCVPYDPVARHAVSYQALHEAFVKTPLRPESGPVASVKLPASPSPQAAPTAEPVLDPLAATTAALLLAGPPVCVLEATDTTMPERLAFVDAVMALLPYGFRARMSAATWTRATNQNHRFRLFFSGARRDAKEPDSVVPWGHPEQANLTPDDDLAYWYLNWLGNAPAQQRLGLLAEVTRPRSLANKHEVHDALDELEAKSPTPRGSRFRWGSAAPGRRQKATGNLAGSVADVAAPAKSAEEQLLLDCARYMAEPDPRRLLDAARGLNRAAKAGLTPSQRERSRELIREQHLFRHDEALGESEATLREVLVRLAFGGPLTYEDYCLIEEGAGDAAVPDSSLLRLTEKQGLKDNRVKAIVYRQLPGAEADTKLAEWFADDELGVDRLINLLPIEVKRPRHLRLLCDVTTCYLRTMAKHYEPKDVDRLLRQHSYLARRLEATLSGQNQYQIDTLGVFLRAAYPGGLSHDDLYHLLIGTPEAVTLAFLAAVHLMVEGSADAILARELFVYTSFMAMGLETATSRELERLILPALQSSSGPGPA